MFLLMVILAIITGFLSFLCKGYYGYRIAFCIVMIPIMSISSCHYNGYYDIREITSYDVELIDPSVTTADEPSVVSYHNENGLVCVVKVYNEESGKYDIKELEVCEIVRISDIEPKLDKSEICHMFNHEHCIPLICKEREVKEVHYILYIGEDVPLSNFLYDFEPTI